jgi:hypothetical protein
VGKPRDLLVRAKRSSDAIAAAIASRSAPNSARIFGTFIGDDYSPPRAWQFTPAPAAAVAAAGHNVRLVAIRGFITLAAWLPTRVNGWVRTMKTQRARKL